MVSRACTYHDLAGKSVFITGGGSGIGAALTAGFLELKRPRTSAPDAQ